MNRVKSGVLDKLWSHVLQKLKWPHMNQNPRYVISPPTFNDLNFCQFLGGECCTILKAETGDEFRGRLKILSKIAYLHDQSKSWDKARAIYFAIISSIEQAEADWNSSFGLYDMMCPPPVEVEPPKQFKNNVFKTKPTQARREFFCHEYQKGECNQAEPHRAWVKNSYDQVEHFCGPCYRAKLGKIAHQPGSDGCISKK